MRRASLRSSDCRAFGLPWLRARLRSEPGQFGAIKPLRFETRRRLKLLGEMANPHVAACSILPSWSKRGSPCLFCSRPQPVFISGRNHRSITLHCFMLCLGQQRRLPARLRSTNGGNASSTHSCAEREHAPSQLVGCDLSKLLLLASFFRFLALVISRLPATC